MTYKVLISDPLSEDGIYPLREAENLELIIETKLSDAELLEAVKDVDALLVRSQTQVTRQVIEAAKKLQVIGRAGVGVDNIDLDAATENGVVVVNAPNGNTNSAAEHTISMMMSLSRNIPQAFHSLQEGKWDRKKYVGVEVKGKTLGVIGFGRIGVEVATRAKGQRMNVIAYDPFLTEEKARNVGVDYGSVEDVLKVADYVTVHTPLLKETKHMINKEAFGIMKDNVRVINCARGGIIDEEALYDAIVEGKVAGAAIDVFEEEPATDNKLLSRPEVIATPHLGASTIEAQENVAIDVSHEVVNILAGGLAEHPVNIPSVPEDVMSKIKPYFNLSEQLGAFLARAVDGVVEEVNIDYAGELVDVNVAPLTRNTVKGILKLFLGEGVNDVNAAFLAEKRGIVINENKTSKSKGFTNLLTVEIKTDKETHKVAGTLLNGLGARIVRIDNYAVDVVPDGHLVLVHHKDKPGAIGRVGTLLSEEHINIATMKVGRSDVGGDAIMMLTIDKHLDEDGMKKLETLDDISDVRAIDL